MPLDAQGNTVRPAMTGGDKRAQVAAADLVDAFGGREYVGAGRGLCAGRRAAGDQAALDGPYGTGARGAHGRAASGAGLAGVAAAGPAGAPDHRPGAAPPAPATGRRPPAVTGPTWWSWRSGTRRCCRGDRPGGRGRHHPRGADDLRRHGGHDGGGVRARHRARRRGGVAGRVRLGDGRAPRGARRPHRHDHVAGRRDRHAPARGHHAERGAGAARYGRTAGAAGPGEPVRPGDEVDAGRARAGAAAVPGGRAHAEPAAHRRDSRGCGGSR
ncbi:hypothetical protein STENM223S_04807 [Streptomyces tendae]